MGFSAGGHLASLVSTNWSTGAKSTSPMEKNKQESCRPNFSILIYPVITMTAPFAHMGSRTNLIGESPNQADIDAFSTEQRVSTDTPPAFLVHANDDMAVSPQNSILYYQALARSGVDVALHLFQSGGHGFSLSTQSEEASVWPYLCERWLSKYQWIE